MSTAQTTEAVLPEGKTPAWFVVWECHCVETRVNPDSLPARCPGHDRGPIAKPELLNVLDQYVDTHECDRDTCPEPQPEIGVNLTGAVTQ